MGLTITYSLLASLGVAVSVIPTMASTALKNIRSKQQKWFDAFVNAYEKVLKFSLSHKVIVLLITVFLFGLSIYGINIIGTSFLPEMDTPQMSATLKAPQGIEKNDLYAINDQVVDRILEIDDVAYVCAMSGSSGGMGLFGGGGSLRGSSPDTSFYILLAENRTMTNKGVERLIIEKTQDRRGVLFTAVTYRCWAVGRGSQY